MKLMNTSHSFTESVESNIKKKLTKTVIPGLMLQITGYVLYLYCNSLLASVMVIICFLTVIPLVLIVFKIDSALQVIKKRKRALYERYLERRIKKSLLSQMKDIASKDFQIAKVDFWDDRIWMIIMILYNVYVIFKILLGWVM